jgi:4-amino-4-deoxychorismate lyase
VEGAFRDPGLKLIETFGWDGMHYVRLERHLGRMKASAQTLGFSFDRSGLTLPGNPGDGPLRCRLTLDREGASDFTSAPLSASRHSWRVALSPDRVQSGDPRLAHKTSDRALYDRTRAMLPDGTDEAIFLNERGEVAEGTITTVFFDLGKGMMTPPLSSGCLPGCLRAELLERGEVREAVLDRDEMARARLWVGNSLRGLIPAVLR